MIPEFGHFSLILAFCLALVQTIIPLIGVAYRIPNWTAVAKPAAAGQWFFMAMAFSCLTYAFIQNDFSVAYVAQNSNSALPIFYRISAVWGGHEGSLLLWVVILACWTLAVALFSRRLPEQMVVRVISVMGFVSCGFLLFMIATSNPFDRIFPAPLEGRDLNPLLQDPGLIFHPPTLYMGYVGFSVAFGFAIAALLGGNLDSAWARWSRPWTTISWVFLTAGITLGSWWAYYELGWGGWWFWDPVENASFMPWLIGTALIHSLAVTEKRGTFKTWTVLLAIIAFSLSLLGTFLVRSGVLTSVHAFATDPERGIFILAFLGVVIGLSLLLYAWRAPTVGNGGSFEMISRESMLLINNILLATAAGSVLLGTLYPLFLDALKLGKISVGPPYFGTVFYFIMIPLVFFLGLGSLVRWKQHALSDLIKKLRWTLLLSVIAGFIPVLFLGTTGLAIFPALAGAFWIIFTAFQSIIEKTRHKTKLKDLSMSFYGATIAHLGVAVFIIGAVISNTYSIEKDIRIVKGQALEIGDYSFLMEQIKEIKGANYTATQGEIVVSKAGKEIARLQPEKRIYKVQTMPMTEAAIDWGFFRDIYVALGEPLENNAWSMRIYYKPFVRWIWFGGIFMMIGGLLAISDKRYRSNKKSISTQPAIV
ncbi:MAG: hypothetical protein RIT27_2277 [Pseudomonadota bacterium]|jgi:cytochrome c-type biogenesis protein CcmF